MAQSVFVGIDIGASRTKVAVLDADKQLLGRSVKRSGTDYVRTADACLAEALTSARMAPRDIAKTVATGYGRNNVPFADDVKTEIACHAKGCYHYFPQAISIIDIGGQDNKIIKLDDAGLRIDFKMNRKCAAGTGAFLEEMALRLTIPLEEMNAQAARSTEMVKLGSYRVFRHRGAGTYPQRETVAGYRQGPLLLGDQARNGDGCPDRERRHDRGCGGP
jgi:predicted CoA-substrate-specific enzyme activase